MQGVHVHRPRTVNSEVPIVPDSSGIAVIIPAYNAAAYLDQALASLAAQTHQPAVVVVADDASTDDTAERARRWQSLLPLEVVRLERNMGPGPARHRAILATDMPLLAIFDADDVLLPDHLEALWTVYEQATTPEAPGTRVTLATAQEWDWIPHRGIDVDRRRAQPKPIPSNPGEQLRWVLEANHVTNPLFPRTLYDEVGGFRPELWWGEDWDLWIRMVRAGARVVGTTHPTLLRRIRSDSMTADSARNAELAVAVATRALAESQPGAERRAAQRTLAGLEARRRYYDARALAQRGHPWRARLEAAGGLPGASAKVTAGLATMIAAPRFSLRIEQATRRYRAFSPD